MPRIEEIIKSILVNLKNLLSDVYEWTSHYEDLSSSEEILNNLEEIQKIVGKLFSEFSPKVEEERPEVVTSPQPKQQPLQQTIEEVPETTRVEPLSLEVQLESKIVPPFDAILNVLKPGVRGDDVAETLEKIKMDLGEKIGGIHPVFFKMTKVIAKIRRKRTLTQEDVSDLKQLAYEWSVQSGLTT